VKFLVRIGARECTLEINDARDSIAVDGVAHALDARLINHRTLSLLLDGASFTVYLAGTRADDSIREIGLAGREATVEIVDPRRLARHRSGLQQDGVVSLLSPMAGRVADLLVAMNDAVNAGQPLLVLEAMKMQNEIRSPKAGRVRQLHVEAGAVVSAGQVLAEIE